MLNSRQAQSRPSLRTLISRGRKRCPLMRPWPYHSRGSPPYVPIPRHVDFRFELNVGLVLDVDFVLDVQVATHLKGLAKKAKPNERHVKAAQVFKAKVASLTSEQTELQGRVQRMTEEVEKLKSDLKHTTSARTRAKSREDEVRNSLMAIESELREVWGELRVAQDGLAETRDGLQSAQYELQMVRDELITSRGELRESKEELRAANDELLDKVALLDGARREAFEAVISAERLNEECRGLRPPPSANQFGYLE